MIQKLSQAIALQASLWLQPQVLPTHLAVQKALADPESLMAINAK